MDERKAQELLYAIAAQVSEGDLNAASATLKIFNVNYPYRGETRQQYKLIESLKKSEKGVERYIRKKSFEKAINKLNMLTGEMDNCLRLKLLKIECVLQLRGSTEEEDILFEKLPQIENLYTKSDLCLRIYLTALFNYYNADLQIAEEYLRRVFSLDAVHEKGKVLELKIKQIQYSLKEAEKYFNENDVLKSRQCLLEALTVDPNNKLISKDILRRKVFVDIKLGEVAEAATTYKKLVNLGEDPRNIEMQHIQEQIIWAKCNGKLNNYIGLKLPDIPMQSSVEDFQILLSIIKKMSPPDVLGVTINSTLTRASIRKASHRLIKRYHPDNNASDPEIHRCCVEIFELVKRAEYRLNENLASNNISR